MLLLTVFVSSFHSLALALLYFCCVIPVAEKKFNHQISFCREILRIFVALCSPASRMWAVVVSVSRLGRHGAVRPKSRAVQQSIEQYSSVHYGKVFKLQFQYSCSTVQRSTPRCRVARGASSRVAPATTDDGRAWPRAEKTPPW